jgi:large subunit ribosomal protein L6
MRPIEIPSGVDVNVDGREVSVKGKLGELSHTVPEELKLELDDSSLTVSRINDERDVRALHGLHRSLIANMVEGVSKGVQKKLEIHGTGYNVNLKGNTLVLQIGYCHPVEFELPENISVEIEQNQAQPGRPAAFTIKGIDKQQLGNFAAKVRDSRPPEPYKGKGIRYADEHVRRKEGKAFAGIEA